MAKVNGEGFYSKRFQIHGDILKCEKVDDSFTGKDGKDVQLGHLDVRVLDDDADNVLVLSDKNVGNEEKYKRGTSGTFLMRIDFSKQYKAESIFGVGNYYCTMLIADFKEDN